MKKVFLQFAMVLFLATGAIAQEEVKPQKHENSSWHMVVLVDFKQGKVGEAKEIIKKFKAAGEAAQTKGPQLHWLVTGEYDLMVIWDMDDGPSQLEWQVTPNSAKWVNEFRKQQGSKEAADKVSEDYSKLISGTTSFITRKDL